MKSAAAQPMVAHGWTVFAHPLFLKQVEALTQQVEALKRKDPSGYTQSTRNASGNRLYVNPSTGNAMMTGATSMSQAVRS